MLNNQELFLACIFAFIFCFCLAWYLGQLNKEFFIGVPLGIFTGVIIQLYIRFVVNTF